MVIDFATQKMEAAVNKASLEDMSGIMQIIRRKKAPCHPNEIMETLSALSAADTLYDLPKTPYHPHPLKGSKKGKFSVWINAKTRIVFKPNHIGDLAFKIDNFKTIKRVIIEELCIDYHK